MVETEVAALIAPWITPTSLFVLLNIVLATIFLANNSNKNQSKSKDDISDENSDGIRRYDYYHDNQRLDYEGASLVPPPPQLVRAPSLFSRVASFNFSNFYSEAQPPPSDETDQTVTVTRAPSLLYRVTSFNFSRSPAPQKAEEEKEVVARDESQSHVMRENQEEKKEENNNKVVKVKKKKVKKEVTAEVKKEEVKKEEVKKEEVKVKETTSSRKLDEEVDSKADDFINRFKQQLKLQRLESLLRYRSDPTPA